MKTCILLVMRGMKNKHYLHRIFNEDRKQWSEWDYRDYKIVKNLRIWRGVLRALQRNSR